MDFSLTEEQLKFKNAVIEFAKKELGTGLIDRDRQGELAREDWNKCARMGILGLAIPEERVHFLQYGAMALLARSALARGTDGYAHAMRDLVLGVALTSTLGLLEECLQGLVPQRVFDWRDGAMNAGAALTTLLLDELLHDRLRLRRREPVSDGVTHAAERQTPAEIDAP